ncbi:diguanylate cyclase [Alkalimonas collagenimarina]|uniref:diguanylate cyclase n=1 Tax=Alkalimonas collagenimarina TaxID=400390 RepID=A0ABT9GXT2_9GAMM|nr:diguanylate cyclase [Alkalimonas collagenimarina]MDP4535828.1 diguanylate cyclase [Alkalimonas collagenimarina]
MISALWWQPAYAVTDPQLEQQVDTYLLVLAEDPEQAMSSLQALLAQVHSQTPASTATRIYGSEVLHYVYTGEIEQAEQRLTDLLQFANRQDNADVMAEALAIKIDTLFYQNKLNEAYQVVVDIEPYLEHTVQPRIRYYAHNLIGRLYMRDNQFEMASTHLYKAYEAVNETDNDRTLLRRTFLQSQLAQLQADLKSWPTALELAEQALESASQLTLQGFMPDLYLLKGYIEGESGQHEASIATHYKAIEWAEKLERPDTVLLSLNNIGASYILMEQYEQAKHPLQQANELAVELNDEYTHALVQLNLGYIDVMQDQHEQGLHIMESAIQYFREHGRKSDLERFLTEYAKALQHAGYHIKEAQILREQRALNQELFQTERDRTLAELQQRFQARDQAHRINRLEQDNELQERLLENNRLQNRLTMLIAIIVALTSLLMWLLYRKVRHANRRLKEANKQLEYHSLRDPLTGLYNRRSFQQRMAKRDLHLHSRRYHSDEIDALVLIDLDFFKQINDQYGHAMGDDILIEVAQRLTDSLRQHDQAIRWGGEEFLLFLHRINATDLVSLVERTLYQLSERPYISGTESLVVTATAGFITLPFAGIDEEKVNWEKALQLADMALYLGKANGRNRACGIQGLKVPYTELPEGFENDLSQAIAQEHIELVTIVGPQVERIS